MATYSDTRTGTGPFLFVSGQTPSEADGTVPGDVDGQVRLVLAKIRDRLAEHGRGWDSVVKLTYYLRDMADLPVLRKVVVDVVPEPRPAATPVAVDGFVDPAFAVEIDAVADLGHG